MLFCMKNYLLPFIVVKLNLENLYFTTCCFFTIHCLTPCLLLWCLKVERALKSF